VEARSLEQQEPNDPAGCRNAECGRILVLRRRGRDDEDVTASRIAASSSMSIDER
jgi:hypothetical protein